MNCKCQHWKVKVMALILLALLCFQSYEVERLTEIIDDMAFDQMWLEAEMDSMQVDSFETSIELQMNKHIEKALESMSK